MGKDWYWAGGRSSKRGGATSEEAETQTTPSGCMCAVFHFFDFHPFHFPTTTINHQQQNTLNKPPSSSIPDDITDISKGAAAPRNSLESEDGTASTVTKEEEEHFKIPKNIQIKRSTGRSTRTSSGAGNLNDLSSSSDSPAKTPTLVARLMGLDLLPGSNSPSSSSSSCLSTPNPQGNVPNLHHHHHMRPRQHMIQTKHRNSTDGAEIRAIRSLPGTPRISSARRSDVDHHHRFSLQINKENIGDDLEMLPRFSFLKRKCDENMNVSSRSSSHLARQIVKHVKESLVSRKVGQDITNNNLKIREQAREELVSQLKTRKSSKAMVKASLDESSPGKHHSNSSSYYSPRLRFTETNKPNTITTPSPLTPKEQHTHPPLVKLPPTPPQPLVNTQLQLPRVLTRPKPQELMPEQQELQNQKSISVPKCNKATNEKFGSRLKRPPHTSDIIKNKQEKPFIVRPTSPTRAVNDIKNATKSKKTHPLSSNLLNNINNVPNLFPIKTDTSPSATKFNQKQVCDTQESKGSSQQLPSHSSQRYKQEGMCTLSNQEQSNSTNNEEDKANDAAASTTGGAGHHRPEFQYITGILSRTTNKEATTNTTTSTTVSLSQRFSPTHPLDPSIFDHLEEHHPISNSHVSSPNNNKVSIFSMKNQLGQLWNQRLMFDLVDEVLMEILRPRNSEKKLWFLDGCTYQGTVEGLMERVWNRIGKFPCKKCEFLEDIDGLIGSEDMEKVKVESEEGLEEEGEALVGEIEDNIWDTIVHESVREMFSVCYKPTALLC